MPATRKRDGHGCSRMCTRLARHSSSSTCFRQIVKLGANHTSNASQTAVPRVARRPYRYHPETACAGSWLSTWLSLRSTAQHSTAQHSTAQHSTGETRLTLSLGENNVSQSIRKPAAFFGCEAPGCTRSHVNARQPPRRSTDDQPGGCHPWASSGATSSPRPGSQIALQQPGDAPPLIAAPAAVAFRRSIRAARRPLPPSMADIRHSDPK
jgi:hypothetical protein